VGGPETGQDAIDALFDSADADVNQDDIDALFS
jgi:hypothetical protein